MGYYIQTNSPKNKANYLVRQYGGEIIGQSPRFDQIPDGKALVIVLNNGPFEAAGLAFSANELDAFTRPGDYRPRTFVLLDKQVAHKLAGYSAA